MMGRPHYVFTEVQREQLRAMWMDPGRSQRSIERDLNLSSTLVANEAMRLGLPSRSVIRDRDAHKFKVDPEAAVHQQGPRPLPPGARTIPLLPSELAALRERGR